MGLGRKSEEKYGHICQFPSVDYVFWIVGLVGDFCRVKLNQVEYKTLWNIFWFHLFLVNYLISGCYLNKNNIIYTDFFFLFSIFT